MNTQQSTMVSRVTYRSLLKAELAEVEAQMLSISPSAPTALRSTVTALVTNGGKRLRPAIVLLFARIHGVHPRYALPVAAAIEMLHTATLIHDDLVDNAAMRRGVTTLNAQATPAGTVLVGDLLFAHAAGLATRSENIVVVRRFAETLSTICGGELDQLFNGRGQFPTEAIYYERIHAKTASLFGLAAEAGPILALASDEACRRARRFGTLLGQAFQIADDVLDFVGSDALLGKPVGSDLRQGLITLPVLRFATSHPDDPRIVAILTHSAGPTETAALVEDVQRSDAATWSMQRAESHIGEALQLLEAYPPGVERDALREIALFAIERLV